MKAPYLFAVVLLLMIAVGLWALARNRNAESPASAEAQPSNPVLELRNRVLTSSPGELGLTDPSRSPAAWAAVMELGFGDVAASVVALEDGNASLYFSNGGGIIGGYAHEGVRKAAKAFVQAASSSSALFGETQDYPLPADGQVMFYIREGTRTLMRSESETDIQNAEHPLHRLYVAGQSVITELRLTQNGGG